MPTQAPPDSKLADLDAGGKVVTSRVADASHAIKLCQKVVRDDRTRAARRVKVQGAFDGNAPKNQADLIRAGRATDSNLNFKRHRGAIMNAHTAFFDMVCEVPVCIDGDLEYGDSAQDMELMRGFAQFFHELVFNWRGFDDMNQLCDLQMLLHGPGVLAWENEWDFRPKAILADNIQVPDGTDVSLDNCEFVRIYTPRTAGQLWRSIANENGTAVDETAAQAAGWNVDAVKKAIMGSAGNDSDMREWNWMRWEQAFKNGDLYISHTQTKVIQLQTLFVQEMDGTISQKILPVKETIEGKLEFLFDSVGRYDSWEQCICLFPYDIGADGTFHSIKGLGTDIFPFCALLNDIDNSIADLVKSSIKPMWQPTTNAKMEEFKMAKWGGGNFVPNGINPLQVDITRGIMPALEVSRGFSQTMTSNTATAGATDFAQPTVEETAKSAIIRAAERAKTSKGLHNRYMRGKDRQYAEMWRRATNPKLKEYHPGAKEALKFQERCYALCDKLGVEREALQKVTNVRANRSLGLGSPAMRIEIVSQLMANIDRFDEIGKNEILRNFVAVMTSFHNVDAIVAPLTTGRDKTNDEAVAAQENNAMAMLGPDAEVVVVPGQDHVLHLSVHMPSAEADMEACINGQIDPRECFKRLEAKGRHASEHIAALQGNPTRKAEYQEYSARLAEIAAYADHLKQNIEEEDAAAAEQPQPGEPTPEMVKVQGNLELKAQKQQGDLELKAQRQAFDQQLKAMKQASDEQIAAQKLEFEKAVKDAVAAAEINRKSATARADTVISAKSEQAESQTE